MSEAPAQSAAWGKVFLYYYEMFPHARYALGYSAALNMTKWIFGTTSTKVRESVLFNSRNLLPS